MQTYAKIICNRIRRLLQYFYRVRVVQTLGCVLAARKTDVLTNPLQYNVKKQHGV